MLELKILILLKILLMKLVYLKIKNIFLVKNVKELMKKTLKNIKNSDGIFIFVQEKFTKN